MSMRLAFSLLLILFLETAKGQAYPSKPIRLVVPFAPGGSSSLVARLMAAEMEKGLGKQIVIENKPGGGGNIAMQEVARADPDGYTLIIGHVGSLAVNPYMYERLPYDVDRDFAAVSLLAIVPAIFVVHVDVPAKDLREFVALAKSKPGQINYGSAGNGSAGHLAMEYLKQATGMDLQHDSETIDDLSALAWVHDELRRSLEGAHKAMRRYLKEAETAAASDIDAVDPAVLRGARAQLHQGVGALELVGLPTAAQVLRACENALGRLSGRPIKLDAAAVETIERASFALLDYLARLLAQKPVSPLAMFPQYRAVQQLAGAARAHPADLWTHEWQWRAIAADVD